ncbi:integral membrane protein [Aspergillus avenaceus]|uniref:Integral membrane protein n=1 Tax=Aspergillus avenaceus TaxID=36643 RepID=A0A5N6TF66_ASPAV|nr:integral membrane protein [Aspergillus avenaceus]
METDNSNLQPWAIATTTSVTVLAFVTVCLRLLSRYERKQKLWWDDWMIIFSMCWNLVVVGFIFAMIKEGMGLHATAIKSDDPTKNVVMIAKYLVVAEVLYVFNLVWTKISILLMYYRIFHFAYFKTWAYIIGTFVIAWVICITFLFIFICVPVQKLWYPYLPGHCINQVGTWIANAISTILTDLIILCLPIPQVWKLQLRLSEKLAVLFAFGLGSFVVFASAYRFSVLFTYSAVDSSYTLAPTVGWTAIEMSAGIVSACLPTLRPALRLGARLLGLRGRLPALFRSTEGKTNKTSHATQDVSRTVDSTTTMLKAERPTRHSFYHLPDDLDEQPAQNDLFRPDYDHAKTYTNVKGPRILKEDGRFSVDEIPLNGIRVDREFTQTSKR